MTNRSDIETKLDEARRVRMARMRARATGDLQQAANCAFVLACRRLEVSCLKAGATEAANP